MARESAKPAGRWPRAARVRRAGMTAREQAAPRGVQRFLRGEALKGEVAQGRQRHETGPQTRACCETTGRLRKPAGGTGARVDVLAPTGARPGEVVVGRRNLRGVGPTDGSDGREVVRDSEGGPGPERNEPDSHDSGDDDQGRRPRGDTPRDQRPTSRRARPDRSQGRTGRDDPRRGRSLGGDAGWPTTFRPGTPERKAARKARAL